MSYFANYLVVFDIVKYWMIKFLQITSIEEARKLQHIYQIYSAICPYAANSNFILPLQKTHPEPVI